MNFTQKLQKVLFVAPLVVLGFAIASAAHAVPIVVNEIAPDTNTPTNGVWFANDIRFAGTAAIEVLGGGGNLQNNAPLQDGAVKLTTSLDNNDKAEISVVDSYGRVSEIFSSLNVGYSYFKEANNPGDPVNAPFAAPAIKLSFFNANTNGFSTLIYEPTWNQPGQEGTSQLVPTGDWIDVAITEDSGLFWTSGGFGEANSFGGPPLRTLDEWEDTFTSDFLDADLVAISVGVGSFNPVQVGYFDDVRVSHDSGSGFDKQYDFEAASTSVSEPGTLALFGLGLVGLGFAGRRRRK